MKKFLVTLFCIGTFAVAAFAQAPPITATYVTNDPTVMAYATTVGLSDDARTKLNQAVSFLKGTTSLNGVKAGGNRWQWVNDIKLFHSLYGQSKNLSLKLQPWSLRYTNYTYNGLDFEWTNVVTGQLPTPINPAGMHSEVYFFNNLNSYYQAISKNMNANLYRYAEFEYLGGLADVNQNSTMNFSRGDFMGIRLNEGNGTNFVTTVRNEQADHLTNGFLGLDFNAGLRGNNYAGTCLISIVASNHVYRAWSQSMPMIANRAVTPAFTFSATGPNQATNNFTQFVLGNTTNYYTAGYNYYYPEGMTNAFGQEMIACVSVLTNMDDSFVQDINIALLSLLPQKDISIVGGSSMTDPAETPAYGDGNNTGYKSFTNHLGIIRQQFFPNEIWFSWGSPGATINTMNNQPLGIGNFPTTLISNIVAAGKNPIWKTDLGRNDTSTTANSWQTARDSFNSTVPKFVTAGAQLRFIATPMMSPRSAVNQRAQNTNLWLYNNSIRTNPYVWKGPGGYSFPIGVLSTNNVDSMSSGGAHLDNPTNGYPFLVQEMWALEGNSQPFFNPTNPMEIWSYGGNVLPAGDMENLYMLTNNGATFNWGIK